MLMEFVDKRENFSILYNIHIWFDFFEIETDPYNFDPYKFEFELTTKKTLMTIIKI